MEYDQICAVLDKLLITALKKGLRGEGIEAQQNLLEMAITKDTLSSVKVELGRKIKEG